MWINNSDNKPFALLHIGSMQFKNTSDYPIKDISLDILNRLNHFIDFDKYNEKTNKGDFCYFYIPYIKAKYPNLTELEFQFKLDNVKYDKKTNTVDLQNKRFKFKKEYLNSDGTFNYKFINWPNDCSNMFCGCCELKSLPDDFEIPQGVTDCSNMFNGCYELTSLPENFTIPEGVTDCSNMFTDCSNLKSLPENFTIPKSVKTRSGIFNRCDSLSLSLHNKYNY